MTVGYRGNKKVQQCGIFIKNWQIAEELVAGGEGKAAFHLSHCKSNAIKLQPDLPGKYWVAVSRLHCVSAGKQRRHGAPLLLL